MRNDARERDEAASYRMDEAMTFAAEEWTRLAMVVEANGGDDEAPVDGPDDLAVWIYEENIGDTLHENGVPFGFDANGMFEARKRYYAAFAD
jgi:hypothetical protein